MVAVRMRIEDVFGVAVLWQHVAHAYSEVDEHLTVLLKEIEGLAGEPIVDTAVVEL